MMSRTVWQILPILVTMTVVQNISLCVHFSFSLKGTILESIAENNTRNSIW